MIMRFLASHRRMPRRHLPVLMIAALLVIPGSLPLGQVQVAVDVQPTFPLRAAFYYPWFPEAWNQRSIFPYTKYTPTLGYYQSSDQAVIRQHIAAMQYGNIAAGIASWWGQGTPTDQRLRLLLAATVGSTFRWSVYYEPEAQGNPAVATIAGDLRYLSERYAGDPSYLRINDRFVVFVYSDGSDGCAMVDRWKQANTVNAYIVLKVFSGYERCASQPDSWHQYAPAIPATQQRQFSYSISPGFNKVGETPRFARNLAQWTTNVRAMLASGAAFQLITTFNEWGEGTAIESASEWSSASGYGTYLDVLHENPVAPVPGQFSQRAFLPYLSKPAAAVPTGTATRVSATPTIHASATPTMLPSVTPPGSGSDPVLVGAGDIADCGSQGDEATAALLEQIPGIVFTTGDNVYESGTSTEFAGCFEPSWGKYKARMFPAIGNHEYLTSNASGYFNYFGAAAGDPAKGYYSYTLGTWRVIVLNSNCSQIGGCNASSPQAQWLRADLAANPTPCAVAYMHDPRWSSGKYQINDDVKLLYQILYEQGVDVVVAGHAHNYERFAPQDANGTLDQARGVREFVVGTGGKNHTEVDVNILPNSEVRNADTFGVLKLTLRSTSYQWQFVPEAGKTFTDVGNMACH